MENSLQSASRPQPREDFGHPVAKHYQSDEKPGFSEDAVPLESDALTEADRRLAQLPPFNLELAPKVALSQRMGQQQAINQTNP